MSTSTNSSSTPSGSCVVCGKVTTLRCGECLKYKTDYMWFCNIEHKKLIWFVHKRFCGIRSNPFQFPGFSPEEWTVFRNGQRQAAENENTEALKSQWDDFQHYKDPPKGEAVAARMSEPIARLRRLTFDLNMDMLRDSCRHLGEAYTSDDMIVTAASITHPIDSAIHLQERTFPGLACYPEKYRAFWSQFQHKFMTFWAIRQVYAEKDRSEEMRTNLNRCQEEVKKFSRDVVSVTHPQEAARIIYMVGTPETPSNDHD